MAWGLKRGTGVSGREKREWFRCTIFGTLVSAWFLSRVMACCLPKYLIVEGLSNT